MKDNKMFDNRAVIRKLAEFNPDFKFFIVAPNGNEEITMYGVSEENFEVTENSVVINLFKSLIQEINPEKEEESKKEPEEVTEEKKTRKNKKEDKVAEEPEVPEKEEAVADEGDSEDSDSSDE